MGRDPQENDDAEARFARYLSRLPQAAKTLFANKDPDVIFAGFSATRSGAQWLVVYRGIRAFDLCAVVCFGAGDTIPAAMRNAGLAAQRGQWRADKFNRGSFVAPK